MNEQLHYLTIEKSSSAEFKDRGSRFIAFAFPIENKEDFKKHLQALKKEHAKANHHCFAYRIGSDRNNFRAGDDGEPAGSAGKPILGQIDSKQLINVSVVVVRYFGGTLLGVPKLINAYKTSTALALQLMPIVQKPIFENYKLYFDFSKMNDVMTIVKQFNCELIKIETQLFCEWEVGIPKSRVNEVIFKIKELVKVEITANRL